MGHQKHISRTGIRPGPCVLAYLRTPHNSDGIYDLHPLLLLRVYLSFVPLYSAPTLVGLTMSAIAAIWSAGTGLPCSLGSLALLPFPAHSMAKEERWSTMRKRTTAAPLYIT